MLQFGFKRSGRSLPRTDLLAYFGMPNSDEYLAGEETIIGELTYIWGYSLPAGLFAELGECLFFNSGGDPIVKLASEINTDADVNRTYFFFKMINETQQLGKLAIYATDVDMATVMRVWQVFGLRTTLNSSTVLDSRTILR
jgi:hypothetical protein